MRQFLADASHELRTPVTVLRGASQVLVRQAKSEDPDTIATLHDIHAEAVRLSRLVDDLLTLSRLDAGQPTFPQTVPIHPFLQAFVDRYGVVWPGRRIRIADEDIDGTAARVDPDALLRILTNLVDNAARYSRPEGEITVGAHPRGESVAIEVRDEGPGLRPDEVRQIFDRFYRANKSRSRNSGGTGLGLAIVRELAEQSGGRVAIDTGPERGTSIVLTLPLASPAGEETETEVPPRA
jgi:signal transduction histidine kinase